MKRRAPEAALQRACARYLDVTLDPKRTFFTAFPAGGGGRIRGAMLKAMGLKPGCADLYLAWCGNRADLTQATGWIELKSPQGRQSPEQRDFAARMRWLYHRYAIVRSLEELIATLDEWGVPTRAKRKAAM